MSMTPAGGVKYVRFDNPPQSTKDISTAISGLATTVAASIKTLSVNPKTVTEISAALTEGNVELKEHLNGPPELQGNARDQAKRLWRSTLMESLGCRDFVAGNSDITKAIPEMAIHIYAQKIGVKDLEYIRWGERFKLPTLADLGKKQCVEKIRELVERKEPNHEDLFKTGLHIVLRDLLTDTSVVHSVIKDNVSYTFFKLSEKPDNGRRLVVDDAHTGLIAFLGDRRATTHAKIWAAEALGNLAMDPANRIPLFKANAHIPLMALLSEDAATSGAKQAAAGVLDNLSRDANNIKPLSDAGLDKSLRLLLDDPNATILAKEYATRARTYLSGSNAGSA